MNHQREKPGMPTVEELKACFKLPPGTEVYATGGQFENFREGWAYFVFSLGMKGHYFSINKENSCEAISLCKFKVDPEYLYGIGSFPKCQHCLRMLRKLRSAS
jgi:hypothetical protein